MANFILIKFGDNDFTTTWLAVLKIVLERYSTFVKNAEESEIIDLLNLLALPCYITQQHYFPRELDFENMKECLHLDTEFVLFDQPARNLLQERISIGNVNNDMSILDLKRNYIYKNGCVYSV